MGPIQGMINSAIGSTAAAIGVAKLNKNFNKKSTGVEANTNEGVDVKMAAKARQNVQQKINAIYANKELSSKARTRRVGKIIDEYNKGGK